MVCIRRVGVAPALAIDRRPVVASPTTPHDALATVQLTSLMELTAGRPEVVIGLIDGPVLLDHPELHHGSLREIEGSAAGQCIRPDSFACLHGTFVAGILAAKRGGRAPAICPGCTLMVRPIFPEAEPGDSRVPSATPEELAEAIIGCVDAGARLINLSAAFSHAPSAKGERALSAALDLAAVRGAVVVAAAGNQGSVGSTIITRHPAVIAVSACDRWGYPLPLSNLGASIGRRGLSAPGEGIPSLGAESEPVPAAGTSVAAPLVTAALALVWSLHPGVVVHELRSAVAAAHGVWRRSIVPPLLNARAIHEALRAFLKIRRDPVFRQTPRRA